MDRSELLLIGGRSGVGKTAAAMALHVLLSRLEVRHAVVEGDALDLAYPAPWEHGLAERNLSAVWRNYRELGYRRLIFTNTVSVQQIDVLASAIGGNPRVVPVLLRSSDEQAAARLARRESGDQLRVHLERGLASAAWLDGLDDGRIVAVDTNELSPEQVARQLLELTGWDTASGLG